MTVNVVVDATGAVHVSFNVRETDNPHFLAGMIERGAFDSYDGTFNDVIVTKDHPTVKSAAFALLRCCTSRDVARYDSIYLGGVA